MNQSQIYEKMKKILYRKNLNENDSLNIKENKTKTSLPPHLSLSTFYNMKLKNKNIQMITVFIICLFIVVVQEFRFNGQLMKVANDMKNREFLLIPGVPDYIKVRPGEMPTANVLGFSDWFISQYMNFYYGDIDQKYNQLEDYMDPEFREQFKLFTKKSVKEVKDLSVTQVYEFSPATEAKRTTNKNGSVYFTVAYVGKTVRYTNDEQLPPTEPQVVVLKFKTSRIDTTKMWLFKVINLSVMKKSEYDSINKVSDSETISLNSKQG